MNQRYKSSEKIPGHQILPAIRGYAVLRHTARKSGGKKVTYTNPIAVAKNGGWRYGYGNMFYVELVNQYLTVPQVSGELAIYTPA